MVKIAHYRENEQTQEIIEQSVLEHLNGTAEYAKAFASAFNEQNLAEIIALAHDIGKYSDDFQRRIRGSKEGVEHSGAGARVIIEQNGENPLAKLAAYCVMGHHGGLPDGGYKSQNLADRKTFYHRLTETILPDYSSYSKELSLPKLSAPSWNPGVKKTAGFSLAFFTRMLFSCLVDADWLDTEKFMTDGAIKRGNFEDIITLKEKLSLHLKAFENPNREIDVKRNQLCNDCIKASAKERGLYSLTAPTGSGKTLSSLAFALNHAVKNGLSRIIYVVPYNTIIEQNAQVFEKILGENNVVQHHSNMEYEDNDPRRFATENWDAPIIVTSNVQFFESLFANKPGKCRKLHNIANSVIIFDEAQMIPLPYLIPCVNAIGELVKNCRCSAVLATATQSSLDEYFSPIPINEINSQAEEMYEEFRRVTYKIEENPFSDAELVEKILEHKQVLIIVNTRKKAQEIAAQLDGAYHLSTTMFPKHRSEILDEIRAKLENGEICRVVSTSLIEAGVDIDFPTLYREKSGLDSIIQAAGRCNREGKNPVIDSAVYVFEFDDTNPPSIIKQNISALNYACRNNPDIASPKAIADYFSQVRYIIGREKLDKNNVAEMFNDAINNSFSFPFKTVAEQFHLIENNQRTVIIEVAEAKEICTQLRLGIRNKNLLRKMQKYSVNLFSNPFANSDFEKLQKSSQLEILDDGLAILNEQFYDKKYGVSLNPDSGNAIII